jgi:hypothetical protein
VAINSTALRRQQWCVTNVVAVGKAAFVEGQRPVEASDGAVLSREHMDDTGPEAAVAFVCNSRNNEQTRCLPGGVGDFCGTIAFRS